MTVNVDRGDAVIEHLGPLTQQVVYCVADRQFIAGDGSGGDDYRVSCHDADVAVFLFCDAHQSRGRLALAAGGHQNHFFRRQLPGLTQGHQYPRRHCQIAEFSGHFHRVHHAPAHDADFTAVFLGGVHHLLDSGNQRGKGGDHHPAFRFADGPVKRLPHHSLRGGVTRHFRIGGVGEQQQNAVIPIAG